MDLVYNQYPEGIDEFATANDASDAVAARTSITSGIQLGTTWNRYSYTFTTAPQVVVGNGEEGWYGLGFEFPASGISLAIAQVKVELGSDIADYVYELPEKELERCSPYYLRTYNWDQPTGFTGTSRLNEEYVTLGNLLSQDVYDIKFPVEMVDSPSVVLYSPTGESNEAYNVTKKADMRFPRCEGCPIHTYRDWETDRKSTRLNSSHRL